MSRPKNKAELIKAMNVEFGKLCKILDDTPREILHSDFRGALRDNSRDKNARDVLIHLYEWQVLLQNFIANNLKFNGNNFTPNAENSPFLPPPYNWRTYPKLNLEFWQKHQSTDFATALDLLTQSHSRIMNLAQNFSDEELFTKGHFAFTGGANLGSYIISNTSSHYAWAVKQLKCGLK